MFLAEKEFPLPVEYRFLPLEEVFHEPPADLADRIVIFLDCGNIDRMPVDWLQRRRAHPQHRPPPRQHALRRRSTSSTSRPPAPPRSSSTSPRCSAPRSRPRSPRPSTSAWSPTPGCSCTRTPTRARTGSRRTLIEAGRRRQRHLPPPLRARPDREAAPDRARARARSTATSTARSRSPTSPPRTTRPPAPTRSMTEGIIDYLRADRGHPGRRASSATSPTAGRAARKVSLRSTDGDVDVSAIAREMGGGGHSAPPASRPTSATTSSSSS